MSLIRVFVMPPNGPRGQGEGGYATDYIFGGTHPVAFGQVDWFRDDFKPLTPENEEDYRAFISGKVYAKAAASFGSAILVLGPKHAFTIGYDPDGVAGLQ